jgi:hypothetical protein
MEKIIIQTIDCGRHDYWKVDLELINDLNIIDGISEYSFLGTGRTPLNEEGYAYLEIDTDCNLFDKAMSFYNKKFVLDMKTLQAEYDEKYEDHRQWLEELEPWNTDTLEDKGYMWDVLPEDLVEFLNSDEDDE